MEEENDEEDDERLRGLSLAFAFAASQMTRNASDAAPSVRSSKRISDVDDVAVLFKNKYTTLVKFTTHMSSQKL
jgi:hypothetical protein